MRRILVAVTLAEAWLVVMRTEAIAVRSARTSLSICVRSSALS